MGWLWHTLDLFADTFTFRWILSSLSLFRLEAYLSDDVLTHMGLAFSRDTSKKVYIQHKIREDGEMLARYLAPELDLLNAAGGDGKIVSDQALSLSKEVEEKDKGYFFLCGPTWPVPDIYEELVGALIKKGLDRKGAEDRIEQLKEEERYVLEVVSLVV